MKNKENEPFREISPLAEGEGRGAYAERARELVAKLSAACGGGKKLDTNNPEIRDSIVELKGAVGEMLKGKESKNAPLIADALSVLMKHDDRGLSPVQELYELSGWPGRDFLPFLLQTCETPAVDWRIRKAAAQSLWRYSKLELQQPSEFAGLNDRVIGIYVGQFKEKGREKMNAAAFYCLSNMGASPELMGKIGKTLESIAGKKMEGDMKIAKGLMEEGKVVLDPTNAGGIGGTLDGWIKRVSVSEAEWAK